MIKLSTGMGQLQTHNAYGYVRNDPMNLVDPDGRSLKGLLGFALMLVTIASIVTVNYGGALLSSLLTATTSIFTFNAAHEPSGGNAATIAGALGWAAWSLGSTSSVLFHGPNQRQAGGGLVSEKDAIIAKSLGEFAQTVGDKSQGETGNPVVNSTFEALQHYFRGNGEPAELGPDVQDAIINSRDQQYRYDRIREGRTPNLDRGVYGVDVELDGAYSVGDTPIEYQTLCRSGSCTATFTSRGDGFWDVVRDVDRGGPRGEFPGGTPYPFLPFSWQRTFPDPRSTRP